MGRSMGNISGHGKEAGGASEIGPPIFAKTDQMTRKGLFPKGFALGKALAGSVVTHGAIAFHGQETM